MNQRQRERIANILTDHIMGRANSQTKGQTVGRLVKVVGSKAEAARIFERTIRK